MKVRITRSVLLADVPNKVGEMLEAIPATLDEVKSVVQVSSESLKHPDIPFAYTVKILEAQREKLAGLDDAIVEANSILTGLIQVAQQQAEEAMSNQEAPPEPPLSNTAESDQEGLIDEPGAG